MPKETEEESLIRRFGKQAYNAAVGGHIKYAKTESKAAQMGQISGTLAELTEDVRRRFETGVQPLTLKEIEFHTSNVGKQPAFLEQVLGLAQPEWKYRLKREHKLGLVPIRREYSEKEETDKINRIMGGIKARQQREAAALTYVVNEAENWKELGVDVAGGVTGFVAQLAVLKKAMPDLHPSIIWEIQSQLEGRTPGMGAASYAAIAGPAKLIPGKGKAAAVARTALESGSFAGLTAAEQLIEEGKLDAAGIITAAAIPAVLKAPSAIKGKVKAVKAAKQPPGLRTIKAAERPGIGKTVGATRMGVPIRATRPPVDLSTINPILQKWAAETQRVKVPIKQKLLSTFRRRQAARGTRSLKARLSHGARPFDAIEKSTIGYKGEAPVPDVTPPKLLPEQWDAYAMRVLELYPETSGRVQFQRTDTIKALRQIRNGMVPTNRQFELLEPVFGRAATESIFTNLAKKRKFHPAEVIPLGIQLGKSIFGLDPQVLRQGRSVAAWHPMLYAKAAWNNIKAYASPKQSARLEANLKNSAGYAESAKHLNYITTGGYRSGVRLEQYRLGLTERLVEAKFKTKMLDLSAGVGIRGYGKLLHASERGAAVGINSLMKGMWDHGIKTLNQMPNMSTSQREAWLKNRARTINTFVKVVRAKHPEAKKIQQAANYILFSPSVTASRPMSLALLVKNEGSRGYAGELVASNIASISAITAVPAIIANDSRMRNPAVKPDVDGGTNPLAGDFGKIRVKDQVYDFTMGDAPFYRTIARIGVSAYLWGQEQVAGKEQTTVAGKRVPGVGESILRYGETRETAMLGYLKAVLSGKDWLGKPIHPLKATIKAVTPEVIMAAVEAGMADGTWAAMANATVSATGAGADTYPIKASDTRRRYQDILAQKEYGADWDQLKRKNQLILRARNREEFEQLDREVKAERIPREDPFSPERMVEEKRKSGLKILKGLSESNKKKIEGISIAAERRAGNLYLNDERYQQYQESIIKHLNEQLDKFDVRKKRSERVRIALLENKVKRH
jgi:hypothetical protein